MPRPIEVSPETSQLVRDVLRVIAAEHEARGCGNPAADACLDVVAVAVAQGALEIAKNANVPVNNGFMVMREISLAKASRYLGTL